jgi:hypothetical protein
MVESDKWGLPLDRHLAQLWGPAHALASGAMFGEGFDIERPDSGGAPGPGDSASPDLGAHDPGRVAREAADRIAQQVRDVLQGAEQRADAIRSRAESDADSIRRDAAGAAARMLERVDRLEEDLEKHLTGFFDNVRRELESLASREQIEAAAAAARQLPTEPRTAEFGLEGTEEPRFEPLPDRQPEPEAPEPELAEAAEEYEPEPEADEPPRRRGLLRRRRDKGREDEAEMVAIRGGNAEDAHVMALNMALNGTPREETEGYLIERFGRMGDLGAILDDVYGRVRRR